MPRARKKAPAQPYNTGGPTGAPPEQPAQAPTAATGLPYGRHSELVNAQRAIPLPGPTPPPSPAGPGGGPAPQAADILERARQMPFQAVPLRGPTDRPGEPVTTGLPLGPGAGPEALLTRGVDPDLSRLAPYLPMLEFLASRPDSTVSTRNFVRRVRGAMPLR